MNTIEAVEIIRDQLRASGGTAEVPLLKGSRAFKVRLVEGGVEVDNLGGQPFLPWTVFQEAINTIINNDGQALRGDTMRSRLGESDLPLDSIEGRIAHVVYDKQPGDAVFRRITPIACILIWAEICQSGRGVLKLREQ